MDTTPRKPELLAPAGTLDVGLIAFDAGADAVYAGLGRFNARERGQNFSLQELSKLIAYAKRHGRKVYVTFNTLIKENELIDAVAMLAELTVLRPHAILVQDLGLAKIIREHFPVLEVHASTQMGIHNSAGVKVAESMGIKRVILERQTTYDEIVEIQKRTSVELEVFIHGALCCSRSGVCLFSSWMGGWSGNRGKCKQPCRRRYHSEGGNGFFFSPQDLYSLDAIPRLKAMGVASLKIEGRLRRADYVRRVIEAYRLMLDTPEDQAKSALKEARHILSTALGRKWFQGFRSGSDFKEAIRHEALGASGLLVGRVVRASETGFMLEVSRPVRLHDTIRVQPVSGDEGPLLTITKMTVDDKEATQAKRGQQCWIHYDRKVDANAPVFKTGSVVAPLTKRVAALPLSRPELDLNIKLADDTIRVNSEIIDESWASPLTLQPARKAALAPETVSEAFRHAGSETLSAGRIEVEVPENVFLPASELKRARRAFWEWACSVIDPDTIKERWASKVERIKADLLRPPRPSTKNTEVVVNVGDARDNPVKGAVSARPISADMKPSDEIILPDFCAEGYLPKLKKLIDDLVKRGARRFRVTSIYGFDLLARHDGLKLNLSAGFPLPICNRYAIEALRDHGVRKTTAWVELEQAVIESLVERFGSALEVYTHGRVPLLSTRMAIPVEGDISDGRGAKFEVKKEKGLTWILPEKVLSIRAPAGASTYIDLSHAGLHDQATDTLNYFRELV